MIGTALGHRLETLNDGLTTFSDGRPVPVPLVATEIAVRILSGLAVVTTTRSFRNSEACPIEAVITMPVGFGAVVTGLSATIDGRRLVGMAAEQAKARETYETAQDNGQLGVLHEEVLRGIHALSVGALPSGAEVSVEIEQVIPLADAGGKPFLRMPMTTGQLYGTSPLLPTDDLVAASGVRHSARLTVHSDSGRAMFRGRGLAPNETIDVLLDRAIELEIEGASFGQLRGHAANGQDVDLTLEADGASNRALDLHVIVDRSGSTNGPVRDGKGSIWQAMRDGLATELGTLRADDQITLWQFDNTCQCIGLSRGPDSRDLASKLEGPRGGTELAGAIRSAIGREAKDILVLTDGQTWAHMVEELKDKGPRISAVLCGPGSLDANVGHLCALTGGQVLYAPGRDVGSALRSAFAALRYQGVPLQGQASPSGPKWLTTVRNGVTLRATWSEVNPASANSDAIGRFAAALALPLLPARQAEDFARAHQLCTHLTSLVLVDSAGEATQGFAQMRKVPLMAGRSAPAYHGHRDSSAPRIDYCMSASFRAPARANRSSDGSMSAPNGSFREKVPTPIHRPAPDERQTGPALSRWIAKMDPRLWWRDVPAPVHSVVQVFAGFAWDAHGDALLRGEFQSLSTEQTKVLHRTARRVALAVSAHVSLSTGNVSAEILALGLIARSVGSRLSLRFSRRVLASAPRAVLDLKLE